MYQYALVFSLLFLSAAPLKNSAVDAKAIEAAKHTSVRQIESSLPDKPFENWFRDLVGAQTTIDWEVNDCGEQSGNPEVDKGRDFPMCVSASANLGNNRKLYVSLLVGTFKSGVHDKPAYFNHAAIIAANGHIEFVKSLSLLPEAIRQSR